MKGPIDQLRDFLVRMAVFFGVGSSALAAHAPSIGAAHMEALRAGNQSPKLVVGSGGGTQQDPFAPLGVVPLLEVFDALAQEGQYQALLGHQWIVTVSAAWEEHYRGSIAKELGFGLETNLLQCPPMGDLKHLRNDIMHHRGIASERNSGKLKVLDWATVGSLISVGPTRAFDFARNMQPHLDRRANGDAAGLDP